MSKVFRILLFLIVFIDPIYAQILPHEGSNLNYRIIGFSFPMTEVGGTYKIEIAKGKFDIEPAFQAKIIKSVECKSGKIILEIPSFGGDYTWHTVYSKQYLVNKVSELHHFTVLSNVNVDTSNMHLKILNKFLNSANAMNSINITIKK